MFCEIVDGYCCDCVDDCLEGGGVVIGYCVGFVLVVVVFVCDYIGCYCLGIVGKV